MASPRITVVVAAFNAGTLIGETIEGVLTQAFTDWELVIVDDGSTDDTKTVVARYVRGSGGRIRLLAHDGALNRGPGMSRIVGTENAAGDVVALLDGDDVWDDRYLERHLAFWDSVASSRVGMTYGPVRVWYPEVPTKNSIQKVPAAGIYAPGALLEGWLASKEATTPNPSAVFLRPELYPQIRRYADLAHGSAAEDQYLYWYVGARWPIAVHDGAWLRYRKHDASTTSRGTFRRRQRDRLVLYEAIGADLGDVLPGHEVTESGVPRRIVELRRSLTLRWMVYRALRHPRRAMKLLAQLVSSSRTRTATAR